MNRFFTRCLYLVALTLVLIVTPTDAQQPITPSENDRSASKQQSTERPNIVFILIDDLRYDMFGYMGHPFIETPHLDAMAKGGVQFSNAFVTTSLCSPSRASFLTGQYMHNHKVVDNADKMREATVTFPHFCKRRTTKRRLSESGIWAVPAMLRDQASIIGSVFVARDRTTLKTKCSTSTTSRRRKRNI